MRAGTRARAGLPSYRPLTRALPVVLLIAIVASCAGPRSASVGRALDRPTTRAAGCVDAPTMRRLVQDIAARQRFVGLRVVVWREGKPAFEESVGWADAEHRVPVTAQTKFGIASVTKAFAGVAVLRLVERGTFDLDAPIQRYVPEFPVKPQGVVTPRLLAAHLAGIRHWGPERNAELYATHFDSIAPSLALYSRDSLVATPGSGYNYSSPGYNLLAVAAERAAGMQFQRFVLDSVARPAGADVQFDDVRFVVPHRARRYTWLDPATNTEVSDGPRRVPERDYSHNTAGGNLLATVDAIAAFGDAMTRPGVLKPASLELFQAPPRIGSVESPMSFGWFVRAASAGRRRQHINGANLGVMAALFVYPDDRLVVALASNTTGIGARSGELAGPDSAALPERLARACGLPRG